MSALYLFVLIAAAVCAFVVGWLCALDAEVTGDQMADAYRRARERVEDIGRDRHPEFLAGADALGDTWVEEVRR